MELDRLLDDGADPNEQWDGVTLLQHAMQVEVADAVQSDERLHVDITALLLARGADPTRRSHGGDGDTALETARSLGHWLAECLLVAITREGPPGGEKP